MSKKRWVSSVCAFTLKNPDWKSCFLPSHTGIQKSHQLWLCSRPVLTHLHPTPPCSSVSWWGTQRVLRCRTPGDDGGSEPSFPMKDSNCLLSQSASFMGLLWSDISTWPRCLRWQRSQDGNNCRCLQTSFYRTKLPCPSRELLISMQTGSQRNLTNTGSFTGNPIARNNLFVKAFRESRLFTKHFVV